MLSSYPRRFQHGFSVTGETRFRLQANAFNETARERSYIPKPSCSRTKRTLSANGAKEICFSLQTHFNAYMTQLYQKLYDLSTKKPQNSIRHFIKM
jgi:hypothetical protein